MAGAYQPDAFQDDAFQTDFQSGTIEQTVGAFTQSLEGVSSVAGEDELQDVLARVFRDRKPRVLFNINIRISQTMPSFSQSLEGRITDDELVLLLI